MTVENFPLKDWLIFSFNNIENRSNGKVEDPIYHLRKKAITDFAQLGFPTTRQEEWKYTNIEPLLQYQFRFFESDQQIPIKTIEKFFFQKNISSRLVFINGKYSETLSHFQDLPAGVIIKNFKDALHDHPQIISKYFATINRNGKDTFTALNTAFAKEGLFLYLPHDIIIEKPFHILHITDAPNEPYQVHPRHLVIVGKNSALKFIESHHALSEGPFFHNAFSEIFLGANAQLDFYKIQDDSLQSFRIHQTHIYQEQHSVLNSFCVDLGGALVRNNMKVSLDGEGIETNLFGCYLAQGNQLIDNHTAIEHLKPYCHSNELYKGILAGQSRGVFSGTIYVARNAQKTNAFQSNKNLLLSQQAEVNSKPQLKIFADDVKCTHGATIGQLDQEAIFYLQQRGISTEQAHNLLRSAFVQEVIEKMPLDEVRFFVQGLVDQRLKTV